MDINDSNYESMLRKALKDRGFTMREQQSQSWKPGNVTTYNYCLQVKESKDKITVIRGIGNSINYAKDMAFIKALTRYAPLDVRYKEQT